MAVNKLAVRDGDYTVATLGQILFTGDGYANIRGAVYTGAAAQYLNKHIAKASEMQRTADEEEL
ncbi:MAG: hypothetical protein QNJ14_19505 [Woeseiaceae bacterium]|nr:hypothetical protein [Woeseiaceae bacterium]